MKKDSSICFRASRDLHNALVAISKQERRSLSSTINIILADYLKQRPATTGATREKRQYPREAISVPAVIDQPDVAQPGIVTIADVSLGGLRITIPRKQENRPAIDAEGARFHAVFNLPSSHFQIRLACESRYAIDTTDSICVGAVFVDGNFQSYRTLQAYLI